MAATLQPVAPRFNRSLRIKCQEDWLTGEPGAVLLRETPGVSGIVRWLETPLADPRLQADIYHDLPSLLRRAALLTAQGWNDHERRCAARGCQAALSNGVDEPMSVNRR